MPESSARHLCKNENGSIFPSAGGKKIAVLHRGALAFECCLFCFCFLSFETSFESNQLINVGTFETAVG